MRGKGEAYEPDPDDAADDDLAAERAGLSATAEGVVAEAAKDDAQD